MPAPGCAEHMNLARLVSQVKAELREDEAAKDLWHPATTPPVASLTLRSTTPASHRSLPCRIKPHRGSRGMPAERGCRRRAALSRRE